MISVSSLSRCSRLCWQSVAESHSLSSRWYKWRLDRKEPGAILSFAATIPLNAAAVLSFVWIPKDLANRTILGVNGYDLVLSLLLFTCFVLWMITLGLLYGYTGAGKRALKLGSISLLSLYALGCIGMFAS